MGKPPVINSPSRPDRIEAAPSALQVVVYSPEGEVLFTDHARLRQFNTGAWGYHTAGKMDLPRVQGERLQVNVGLTVIGSKDWNKSSK